MHHFSIFLSEVYHSSSYNQSARALEGMMKSEEEDGDVSRVARFYSDSLFSDYKKFHSLRNTYFGHLTCTNLEKLKLSHSFYGTILNAISSTKQEYEKNKKSKDCFGISQKYNIIWKKNSTVSL
eukprot:TRINITY_DN721_c2_g1_i8.p1 TRINITY_DN721_c2_g1~~TRINITY_DN721_c2_g1_i8.p1  ORF type:complete len:124 (+),score=22.93 TRINITY_DN721_c2_g1_i8:796-1167(+)